MDYGYDPALDRLDVAVRAIWRDCQVRGGCLMREVGIEQEVLDQVAAWPARPATEQQVFALLRACPAVLSAALVLLAAYYDRCGAARPAFYERIGRLCA